MMEAVANLPVHQRPFDKPVPSPKVIGLSGNEAYHWILSECERAHIADMLGIDSK
jgi:hypothetical protein